MKTSLFDRTSVARLSAAHFLGSRRCRQAHPPLLRGRWAALIRVAPAKHPA